MAPVALITGPTGGLGLHVAKRLASKGFDLVLVGREGASRKLTIAKEQILLASSSSARSPAPSVSTIDCDFTSLDDVCRVASKFPGRIDYALLNAAVWPAKAVLVDAATPPPGAAAAASAARPRRPFEQTLLVNHLSQFLLARLLLPALRSSGAGRCVFVSSELHRSTQPLPPTPAALFDVSAALAAAAAPPSSPAGAPASAPAGFTPRAAYAATKLLNVWSAREMQRREPRGTGVHFASASPGFVPSTGLARQAGGNGLASWLLRTLGPVVLPFAVSLDEGARRLEAALLGEGEQGGEEENSKEAGEAKYYTKGVPTAPSAAALDDGAAAEAWRLTVEALAGWEAEGTATAS